MREARGDLAGALGAWREALVLLPSDTRQHEAVGRKVALISARLPAPAPSGHAPPAWARRLGPVAVAGFGAWKLIGFAKLAPALSLLASFAVYWQLWGWRFAAGFVASIYLHELGHVAALRREGIPAGAPMFVPGVGAYVRMRSAPKDAHADARIGLAGPVVGAAVAAALFGLGRLLPSPLLLALAHAGAVINLFNLTPLWSLDGARGFGALSRAQRLGIVGLAGLALAASGEGILWLVVLAGAFRLLAPRAAGRADHRAFATFAALIVVLAGLSVAAR